MPRPSVLAALLSFGLLTPGADAQADFSVDVTSGSLPLTVTFTELTPGVTQDALWSFGEHPFALAVGPVAQWTYTNPGTYDVTLTSYVGEPPVLEQVTKPGFITVNDVALDAAFTWDVSLAGAPATVQFTDTTTGEVPTSWLWDFGDGHTSSEQHPSHTYAVPGLYTVSLEATFFGVSDDQTAPGAVSVASTMSLSDGLVQSTGLVGHDLLTPELDGDGLPDLLAADLGYGTVPGTIAFSTLLNEGGGIYGPPLLTILGVSPRSWTLGDVDGDSLDDVVYAGGASPQSVEIRRSLGTGALSAATFKPVPTGVGDLGLVLFDGTGDSDLDLLVHRESTMRLFPGDGAGNFGAASGNLPIADPGVDQASTALDVDGDGDLDLLLATKGAGVGDLTWRVALNDGAGSYVEAAWTLPVVGSVADLEEPVPGDFDGDGILDVAMPLRDPLTESGWHLQVLHGDGGVLGTDLADDLHPVYAAWGTNVAGDVNLDGVDDLFLMQAGVATGGGHFPTYVHELDLPVGLFDSVAMADVDGDGDLDLLGSDDIGGWSVCTIFNESTPPGWTTLGGALAGSQGEPSLVGSGDLTAGSNISLAVADAAPFALTAVIIGLSRADLPYKGGVLVPSPDVAVLGSFTDAQGDLQLGARWVPGIGPGISTWWQVWIADGAGPSGAAATNAVVSRT
jgi:PKD repeat protein